jgi:hypothetical protein
LGAAIRRHEAMQIGDDLGRRVDARSSRFGLKAFMTGAGVGSASAAARACAPALMRPTAPALRP